MAIEKQHVAPRAQGFTLIEMVVVIAIISVVAVFGLDIGRNAISGSERLSTQEKLATIQKALDAYADRNGYLPCPASPTNIPTDATFGYEQRTGTICDTTGGVTLAGNVYFGMVPLRSLGLTDGYAGDAWANKFTYAVSNAHIGSFNSYYNSAASGTITIRTGIRTGTFYTITTSNTGLPAMAATYAVVSHGRDGRGAYPLYAAAPAIACGASATLIDVENCDRADGIFYDAEYNEGAQASTHFDDYIVWGSNALQRNPASTIVSSCPGTSCEPWCAPCEAVRTSTAPVIGTRVCAKFITSTAPSCQALCIWPSATTPCP